jgi:hypothetical protein
MPGADFSLQRHQAASARNSVAKFRADIRFEMIETLR